MCESTKKHSNCNIFTLRTWLLVKTECQIQKKKNLIGKVLNDTNDTIKWRNKRGKTSLHTNHITAEVFTILSPVRVHKVLQKLRMSLGGNKYNKTKYLVHSIYSCRPVNCFQRLCWSDLSKIGRKVTTYNSTHAWWLTSYDSL